MPPYRIFFIKQWRGRVEAYPKATTKSAFNTTLPAPDLPVKEKNKLEIYMEAERDSAKKKAEWEKDPNNKRFYDPGPPTEGKPIGNWPVTKTIKSKITLPTSAITDPNEKKVNDRLEKLYAALNQPGTGEKQGKAVSVASLGGQEQT